MHRFRHPASILRPILTDFLGTGRGKARTILFSSIHRECFEDGEVVVGSMEKARWTLRLAGGLFCGKAGRGAHAGTGIARSHEYTVIENQYLHSRGWEYASRILHPATIEIFRPCCAPRPPLAPSLDNRALFRPFYQIRHESVETRTTGSNNFLHL